MAEYAKQVLDAMGIENGPGHMEVMKMMNDDDDDDKMMALSPPFL